MRSRKGTLSSTFSSLMSSMWMWCSGWSSLRPRGNQKFIKDTKSNMRRRLCRRYGENVTKKKKDANNDLQTEGELIFEQSEGVFASDY